MFKKFSKEFYINIGIALTVILVTAVVIWGAWRHTVSKIVPIENAAEVYSHAVAKLSEKKDIYYKVTGSKKTESNGTITEEKFTQLITYEAQTSQDFRGCVEEELLIGNHKIQSFDFYANGTALFTTQGASFQSEMTKDAYIGRYTPASPIDPSLYAEITGTKCGRISTIIFDKSGAAECWVTENGCDLVDATATATIDKSGNLTSSNYIATYNQEQKTVTLQITVDISQDKTPPIQLPDRTAYTPIADISVPKTLERACGYLTATQRIYANYTDTVFCEAFGDQRVQKIDLCVSNADDYVVKVDTTVTISNSSKSGSATTSTKNELFEKGAYSHTIDGVLCEDEPNVDQAAMESYCESLLINTILLPDYIASVEVLNEESVTRFNFKPTDDFANILAQDACLMLYQNATILIEQARSYKTDTASCYLDVDKTTGNPIASGFYYSGTYDIGGIPYKLSFKADQQYSLTPFESETSKEDTLDETEAQETEVS